MKSKKVVLFKDVTREWLAGKKARVKRSTYYQYTNLIQNHIDKTLGELPLDLICNRDICHFFNSLTDVQGNNLSTSTVKSIIYITKAVINYAIRSDLMEDPKIYFESPGKCHKREVVFSRLEEKELTNYLLHNRTTENIGILMALYTGIRLGELCALQWKNINLTECYVYIEKTVSRLPDEGIAKKTKLVLETPKSFTSIRYIPLPNFLVEILKQQGRLCGPEDFLVTGTHGKIPEPRTMQNKFRSIERKASIPSYNFHVLRHTFATRCVELGFDIKSLSEILGHASVNITLNRYVHSSMDMKKTQMLLLQQEWISSKNTSIK